jgi:hypothetical protein
MGATVSEKRRTVTTSLLLRIASIISLLFAAGHTAGASQSWSPAGETEVLRAMRSFQFTAEGVNRTYWDFHTGFGFIISIYLFLQSVLLWQLAAIAKTDPVRVRPLTASFFLASVASVLVSSRFIFAIPAVFAGLIAVCLGVTFLTMRAEAPMPDASVHQIRQDAF